MTDLANRLAGETSPYLLQHADNPVAWQPWDEQALTAAQQSGRPVLLSIGYSACHWCHVMAHESFEDPAVATVMNRLFVNIKVDREERPDLDQIYQLAHQMLTGRPGGWPLTLFLTPDGTPFWGGTYFPKAPRYGLPGFADLCTRIAATYADRRGEIDEQNVGMRQALANAVASPPPASAELDRRPVAATCELLARTADRRWGGFGGAPKFPHPADLAFLLRRPEAELRQIALLSLRCMADGGLFDQLGGGFARYSVDERWEIPHFEKMLYDNGPLLALYADAWALTGEGRFREVAEQTAGWLLREMTDAGGGFHSSLDADSEGGEGRFYVWRREEVESLLTADESALAARLFGLDGPPNFEDHAWHLRVAAPPAANEAASLETVRMKLLAAREQRVRPGCDDKILTAWNGLMIAGLAHAARVLGRADWLAAAQRAADFLRRVHWRDGRLLATSRHGRAHLAAYLDDHAYLLAGLLELLQAAFRPADLDFATALADRLLEGFEDPAAGGFFFTAHDHEALIQRPKPLHDNATPAGNGIAAWALQRLGHLLGEPRYLDAARRTLDWAWPQLQRGGGGAASVLFALEEALEPPDTVILRGPSDEVADWQRRLGADPARLVIPLPNGLAGLPPALAKPESSRVNAWPCRGVNCLPAVAEFHLLQIMSGAE